MHSNKGIDYVLCNRIKMGKYISMVWIRRLLLPFSLVFGALVWIKNFLYDRGILASTAFQFPVLVVGNLSTGGSGKTPMVEYLIRLYRKNGFEPVVLSRGYGRKSKGFLKVEADSDALLVGDEPLQIKCKYPDTNVFVCENRVRGIEQIVAIYKPEGKFVIICDDAFQHRRLKAAYYLLLWTYDDMRSLRLLLPAGNFREPDSARFRSDIQVVTKVPEHAPNTILQEIENYLEFDETPVFFSQIQYGGFYNFYGEGVELESANVLLVSGIANPSPLIRYLAQIGISALPMLYKDHHNFSTTDIHEIIDLYNQKKFDYVLFTEKDYVRIKNLLPADFPAIYIRIKTRIIKEELGFEKRVLAFVQGYYSS